MDDSKDALNEIDRTLAEALDVDVSPDFMARVRQRIASEPVRAPFWHGWRLALPVAAAAVVIVAAVVTMLSMRRPVAQSARSLPPESAQPAGVRPAPSVPASAPRPEIVRARVESGARVASAPPEAEVLVPREEIEMYRRLMAAAQNMPHALVVEGPRDIVSGGLIKEITIDPIKIDLIIPSVDGEGDRQ